MVDEKKRPDTISPRPGTPGREGLGVREWRASNLQSFSTFMVGRAPSQIGQMGRVGREAPHPALPRVLGRGSVFMSANVPHHLTAAAILVLLKGASRDDNC